MAGASLLALIDDIAQILDDVATLTKVAVKKTSGVLGDDLALNAQQVSGVQANREWPVIFAVARGSIVNKAILVPSALLISSLLPSLITPLLMIGGAFLCFEGVEKLAEKLLHHEPKRQPPEGHAPAPDMTPEQVHEDDTELKLEEEPDEKTKIKGAVRTDFILSAEIITISLGAVAASDFVTRLTVLTGVAAIMTVGVYGLVALIVKIDDVGLWLIRGAGETGIAQKRRLLGSALLWLAPNLMKLLGVAGTAAMFMVGGGTLVHGIGPLHHWLEQEVSWTIVRILAEVGVGIAVGIVALGLVTLGKKLTWAKNW